MATESPQEFWTDERCWISELLNHEEYPEVSIARTRVEPGVVTQRHALSVSEWYLIESGTGRVDVGDQHSRDVGPGDVVTIPKHSSQRIENCGDEDLVFLCVCAPRFLQKCYTPLE